MIINDINQEIIDKAVRIAINETRYGRSIIQIEWVSPKLVTDDPLGGFIVRCEDDIPKAADSKF